jgi:hypothetical protein
MEKMSYFEKNYHKVNKIAQINAKFNNNNGGSPIISKKKRGGRGKINAN